eukprot:g3307.t1
MRSHEDLCRSLRGLMDTARDRRLTKTVAFYGEKLLTISTDPEDIYLVSLAFHDNGEYRRAVSILMKHKLTRRNTKFLYLAAKSLLEVSELKDCESLLEAAEADDSDMNIDDEEDWKGSLYLLRAQLEEARENLPNAVSWYQKALIVDPFCYDAFHALICRKLMSPKNEAQLINDLAVSPDIQWIKPLYTCLRANFGEDSELALEKLKEASRAVEYESLPPTPVLDPEEAAEISQSNDHPVKKEDKEVKEGFEFSMDIQLAHARWYLCKGSYYSGYKITKQIMKDFPNVTAVYPLHVIFCYQLKIQNELYACSSSLSQRDPGAHISWFAIGMYYMCIQRFRDARIAFKKAVAIDQYSLDCWISYGHALAELQESASAMEAYRTAYRQFPGSHLPLLYIGMEQLRLQNYVQAKIDFARVYEICPEDPLIANELGVMEYLEGNYEVAVNWFQQALDKVPRENGIENWVNLFINLGHALRKQRRYEDAIAQYQKGLLYAPNKSCFYTALGFTYHLQFKLEVAIEHYQKALSMKYYDQFATDMLNQALEDKLEGISDGVGTDEKTEAYFM